MTTEVTTTANPENQDDQSQNLQQVLQAKHDLETRESISKDLLNQIKMTAFFECNWEDLLMAAPVALSNIGKLYAASSSEIAQTIQLDLGTAGEKKITNDIVNQITFPSLKANLVECGDHGRSAFLVADKNMGLIQDLSGDVYTQVKNIIQALGDPEAASRFLRSYMDALKSSAGQCRDAANNMDEAFDAWLSFVTALHAVIENTSTTNDKTLDHVNINLAATTVLEKSSEEALKTAQDGKDTLAKSLETAREAYKKASDNYPSGWDIIGQQIVGDLASAVITLGTQFVSSYIDNMNPMAKVKTGVDMFDQTIHPDDKKEGGDENGSTNTSDPTPPVRGDTRPVDSNDPAFAQAIQDNTYLTTLNALLTGGKDESVNWESAAGVDLDEADSSKNPNAAASSAEFVLRMLQNSQESFKAVATTKQPSISYTKILDTAVKVVTELQAAAEKGKAMNNKWPGEKDEQVQSWKTEYGPEYELAVQMVALARSLPGNISGGAPIMSAKTSDPAADVAKTNAKTAQAKALLDAAQSRLDTTQKTLVQTQEIYQKQVQLCVTQQNKLGDLKSQMDTLTHSQLSLEQTKDVLARCIQVMIPLKDAITKLVRYFDALAGMIDVVVGSSVEQFLKFITSTVDEGGDSNAQLQKIGDYTITDFERTHLYQSSLMIGAYFSLLGDIANMYKTVSTENIFPGITLAEDISVVEEGANAQELLDQKVDKLSKWADAAQEGIQTIVGQERKKILDGMDATVSQVGNTIKMLPLTPAREQTNKCVTKGTKAVADSAVLGLDVNAQQNPMNRFDL